MIRNFSAFSLKAPWNCVAIRLQKPLRQFDFDSGMAKFPSADISVHPVCSVEPSDAPILAVCEPHFVCVRKLVTKALRPARRSSGSILYTVAAGVGYCRAKERH